jgi:hypothetical protein
MKITVYSDKDCVLRYNKYWPTKNQIAYDIAMQKAKDESVPFEDQDQAIKLLKSKSWSDDATGTHKPYSFYTIEIQGKVEIVAPECKEKDCACRSHDYCRMSKQVARITPEEETQDPPIFKPVRYSGDPEQKATIKYGRYLVVRKDGKRHIETFNGTGWAYNENAIIAFYLPMFS